MFISKSDQGKYEKDATLFSYNFASICEDIPFEDRVLLRNYLQRYFLDTYFKYCYIIKSGNKVLDILESKRLARIAAKESNVDIKLVGRSIRYYKHWIQEYFILCPKVFKFLLNLSQSLNRYLFRFKYKGETDILFVAFHSVHLEVVEVLLSILSERSLKVSIATTDPILLKMSDSGYKMFYFYSVPQFSKQDQKSYNYKIWISSYLKSAQSHKSLVSSKYFENVLESMLHFMDLRKQRSEDVILATKPRLIITMEEGGRISNSIALAAKKYNIPVINISHAIFPRIPGLTGDMLFDSFLVYGQSSIDILLKGKYVMKRCNYIPIGACKYDKMFRAIKMMSGISPLEYWRRFGIDVHNKIILLYISTPVPGENKAYERKKQMETLSILKETCINREDIYMIVKNHPVDRSNLYQKFFERYNRIKVFEHENIELYEALFYSDVILNTKSAGGLEALCLNKKMIVVHANGEKDPYGFVDYGAALMADSYDSLNQAIDRLCSDREDKILKVGRNKFVAYHLLKFDGNASQRAADYILSYLQG